MQLMPNIVFLFSDQHRAQSVGYMGNKDVITPNLDKLASESISFTTAVSGLPVCSPFRASLITGQYPLTHGVFLNDVSLSNKAVSIAQALKNTGYNTAYIGKWHLDGHGRKSYIPKERRQGFDYWRVMECTHQYYDSWYYGDEDRMIKWDGYDASAQTNCAVDYIKQRNKEKPFVLFVSWGPPHNPFHTAPPEYKELYTPATLELRPNLPDEMKEKIRNDLAGYYAHISALDAQVGRLLNTIKQEGIDENTLFIYTSDHGEMMGSHGVVRKQYPWDESILVPFLMRFPRVFGLNGKNVESPIAAPDIMPTILGLCGADIPSTVEGTDYTEYLKGNSEMPSGAALIQCVHPFGEFCRKTGGKEYRGIRTARYTYVRDLNGPWLLYDNNNDPYQLENLCGETDYSTLQNQLDEELFEILNKRNDNFLSGDEYLKDWGYEVTGDRGTILNREENNNHA